MALKPLFDLTSNYGSWRSDPQVSSFAYYELRGLRHSGGYVHDNWRFNETRIFFDDSWVSKTPDSPDFKRDFSLVLRWKLAKPAKNREMLVTVEFNPSQVDHTFKVFFGYSFHRDLDLRKGDTHISILLEKPPQNMMIYLFPTKCDWNALEFKGIAGYLI